MPAPTMTVEWAPNNSIQGIFRIGRSRIGGPDVIGGSFAYNDWEDLTSYAKSGTILRGRTDDLTQMQMGIGTLKMKDPDGRFNPENPSSPLYGLLRPMRPIRIKAQDPTTLTTHTLLYGFIRSAEHNPDRNAQESTLRIVDLFHWFNRTKPTIASTGPITAGAAIGKLLDAVGWTDTTMRSLGTGKTIPDLTLTGESTALSVLQQILTADRGVFFITGAGIAKYVPLTTMLKRQSAVATYTESTLGVIRPSIDVDRIINRQMVTRTGGVQQSAQDKTSQRDYGYGDGSDISSPYLMTDSQAASLATHIVGMRKDPIPPVRRVGLINRSAAVLTEQLSRELLDYVTIAESLGGTSTSGFIEQIQHEFIAAAKVLKTTFVISKKTKTYFTIGQSRIGSADVLAY